MLRRVLRNFATKKDYFWNDINPNVLEAQYAVRGLVPNTANQIQEQIKQGSTKYPFKEVTLCNIGNPQAFNQKPVTFNREVLACLLDTNLLNHDNINPDAKKRAKTILEEAISIGSYTHSLGLPLIRESVANFIQREDGVPRPSTNDIFLTDGASQGVHLLLQSIILGKNDSIMIPIPQYPLYSAAIALNGGSVAPYYLDQSSGWQLDIAQLDKSYQQSTKDGKTVKAICVINPGNPTGAILSEETIQHIIKFAVQRRLLVIADQVYRQNIYKDGAKFVSFRRVLEQMSDHKDKCELASLHSVSKGLTGECGLRGGYLYLHNFNPKVHEQIVKLKSINLCSNTIGQSMVELLVNPPLQNVAESTKQNYLKEMKALYDSLKSRARLVTKALNQMTNIKAHEVEGAMYAFPSITFSKKAIQAAKEQGQEADLFYCLEVLKNTGIALVPGSGFKQQPGTYHFRITTLILPEEKLAARLQDFKRFNEGFHKKYAD